MREAGLQSRVFLPGKVAHEGVPAWLAAADIVVLASSSEGLPNSLVEVSACARPIVATRTDGIPEVVLDGETGLLVPKGGAAALAAAIGRLLDGPELARRMGEAGRRLWPAADVLTVARHLGLDSLDVRGLCATPQAAPAEPRP